VEVATEISGGEGVGGVGGGGLETSGLQHQVQHFQPFNFLEH
jgi:hypothetical protein